MIISSFDATLMLNDHHLAMAAPSTRKADAVAAVRRPIERMEGAGWLFELGVRIVSHHPEDVR
jgi:hypothetical protein